MAWRCLAFKVLHCHYVYQLVQAVFDLEYAPHSVRELYTLEMAQNAQLSFPISSLLFPEAYLSCHTCHDRRLHFNYGVILIHCDDLVAVLLRFLFLYAQVRII